MEELLRRFLGKKIDVNCGSGSAFGGEVIEVNDGILSLKDDDGVTAYVAIGKIAFIVEKADEQLRPGFIV